MKKYLVITIDVEPDCSPDWRYSDPLTFNGVSTGIAGRLQPLFNEFGLTPTYLLNNVVLEDKASVDVLGRLSGKYELGTHLHPEFIAPEKQFTLYAGKKGAANCCFYPPEIETAKIGAITNLFRESFGYAPTSFRAGRFSAGANTIASLARFGYKVDTSVTPHLRWDDATRENPVDFTKAAEQPYFTGGEDICKENEGGAILEVPVSIALLKRDMLRELIVSAGGLRHGIRKYRPVWLRPHYSTAREMMAIADQFGETYAGGDKLVLNMMFHNVEVLPLLSPYTRTEADCKDYIHQLRLFFGFCARQGFSSIALSDLHAIYQSELSIK